MNISEVFIRRPIATSLLMAALALVGIVAFPLLPVAPLPQVDFPTIQVSATVPGASPETMAATVATPLERQFGQIAGVAQMSSVSSLGSTVITLQFDLNRNIDGAAQDVQAAITAAGSSLPKNLSTPPTYRKVNPADSPILIVSANSDTVPLPKVDDFAENVVAQQISQISGVAQVAIGGQQKPAIRVQVDPAKLQARQLTLEDVRTALTNATTDVAKGTLLGKQQSFTIAANDQLTEADDYNNVIIAYRNGAPVHVRDVGQAIDGPQDVTLGALHRDHVAVVLLVFKQPGANVIDTVDNIKSALKGMSSLIPPGIHLDIIVDRTQTIRASVKDVEFTLLLSCALVVLVILLFLRSIQATLIPGAAVPLSLLGAVAIIYLLGYSLDNLSLMALTIAVGFVVDDAIVVVENIFRHLEAGTTPLQSAIKGAREIGFTVISISVSLIAVFIPLLLMSGIVGRLFHEFAITVTAAIVVSVVVSLTLTPMLCSRFLVSEHDREHGRLYRAVEWGFDKILDGYRRGLDFVLAASVSDAAGVPGDRLHHRRDVRHDTEGIFPDPGHRHAARHFRGQPGHLAATDDGRAAPAFRNHRAGSRRRRFRIVLRPELRQYAKYRPLRHRPEAARRPRRQRLADHRPAAPEARADSGRAAVPAGGAGYHRRRPHRPRPVPIRHAGSRPARAEYLGAEV